jgi:poly-gamma-glutamate system protein
MMRHEINNLALKGGVLNLSARIKTHILLVFCALTGILVVFVANRLLVPSRLPGYDEMKDAALLMKECSQMIKKKREALGYPVLRLYDLNATGFIGEELTSITTTTGSLEAKRSAASPDFAALMVRLYREAGLVSGDTIALGASGSFPGAFIASLSAAKAMNLRVIAALSLGASNWGANIPELTILDMYRFLEDRFSVEAVVVSLGGSKDTGNDFGLDLIEGGRDEMIRKIHESGLPFILETDFSAAVKARMDFYKAHAGPREIAAFVNIGGADVNIGLGVWSLELQPGINKAGKNAKLSIDRNLAEGGCISAFLSRGKPVIHILNIKTLAAAYGMAFDPFPLPETGSGAVYFQNDPSRLKIVFLASSVFYIFICAGTVILLRKDTGRSC